MTTRLVVPEWHVGPDVPTPGTLIGRRADNTPIYLTAGGTAATIVDNWIPIEYDSDVVMRVLAD